ncbi:MAG TPA: c-type cytochrome biogenesis protein CcmF, partial [Burkholderiales bacterium]|nr:c-type cytochrome biogenesis protein CcmF [Burkholderiales bacterium]
MIPELGQFALALALALALFQAGVGLAGAHRADANVMAFARPAAQSQALLTAFAFGCLVYAFVTNDFSVQNVASNSNSRLPLEYRIAASWGSHEGSL